MKKFIILFSIILGLSFCTIKTTPVFADNIFKAGVFSLSDLNISANKIYTVQNTSSISTMNIIVFNEHPHLVQFIELEPNSKKYNLVPLNPEDKLIIVGTGEIYIDLKPLWYSGFLDLL